jgi:hypothetical protein
MKTQVCLLALYGAVMCVAAAESARPVRIVLPEVADDLTRQVRVGDTVTETKTGRSDLYAPGRTSLRSASISTSGS